MGKFFLFIAYAAILMSACGRKPFDPAEVDPVRNTVSNGVETVGLEMEPDHNAQINIPLPGWIVSELASRPRSKIATDTSTANIATDSAIYVVINNISKRSTRTIFLSVDLVGATASASVNIEVGTTVFQGFYRDRYGVILYQSDRVVANIEKGRIYQVTLKMKRAAVAPANINVTWDTTSAAISEPVVIPAPPPPPPATLTLTQLFASAYYVIDGRERLEFLIVFAADAGGSGTGVDLQGFDVKIVGSLGDNPIDTLIVVEKQDRMTDILLLKTTGSAVLKTGNEGRLQVNATIPNGERKIFLVGGIVAKAFGLNNLINQTLGLSITKVVVKEPARVVSGVPLGQALPLGFVSESQPILLPRL